MTLTGYLFGLHTDVDAISKGGYLEGIENIIEFYSQRGVTHIRVNITNNPWNSVDGSTQTIYIEEIFRIGGKPSSFPDRLNDSFWDMNLFAISPYQKMIAEQLEKLGSSKGIKVYKPKNYGWRKP